jgi:hypothetical protein
MLDMINPQKGIDLMNNNSIINRILFAVTIFQRSALTRRVFYNIIRRERETTSTTSGKLTVIYINHQKFFFIINIIIHIRELEWHHHHLHQHGLV